MIYITYKNSEIFNVWDVPCNNMEEKYIEFMLKKAKEINIIINPYWLNIMNWQDHNNHLSIGEYENKQKQWSKIKRQWNIDKFISEIIKGQKQCYRSIIQFNR